MTLESDVENKFLRLMKKHRCIVWKFTPEGLNGYPDRLIALPEGKVLWIEFKRPGEKPRPLQEHRIQQLRELGHSAGCFDDAEKAYQWVQRRLK